MGRKTRRDRDFRLRTMVQSGAGDGNMDLAGQNWFPRSWAPLEEFKLSFATSRDSGAQMEPEAKISAERL